MVTPPAIFRSIGRAGFTLIEMSIVLVIIGLIIGGVLVGRDLINAAAVRAQISQIETYQTAVNTFRGKYGYLPGDIPDPVASQYGFQARGQYAGEGDGNGVIEGIVFNGLGGNTGTVEGAGETVVFWEDLSKAGLIDGGFNTGLETSIVSLVSGPGVGLYFPPAKIGEGNYIYAYSGGISPNGGGVNANSQNYFELASVSGTASGGEIVASSGLTVAQAQNIDIKVDDGLPQSGKVMALLVTQVGSGNNPNYVYWSANGSSAGAGSTFMGGGGPTTAATAGSATTCFDNGGVIRIQNYSMGQNGGAGINCALSFQFE